MSWFRKRLSSLSVKPRPCARSNTVNSESELRVFDLPFNPLKNQSSTDSLFSSGLSEFDASPKHVLASTVDSSSHNWRGQIRLGFAYSSAKRSLTVTCDFFYGGCSFGLHKLLPKVQDSYFSSWYYLLNKEGAIRKNLPAAQKRHSLSSNLSHESDSFKTSSFRSTVSTDIEVPEMNVKILHIRVPDSAKGYGFTLALPGQDRTEDSSRLGKYVIGIPISYVESGSTAHIAGLQVGWRVLEINLVCINGYESCDHIQRLIRYATDKKMGGNLLLTVAIEMKSPVRAHTIPKELQAGQVPKKRMSERIKNYFQYERENAKLTASVDLNPLSLLEQLSLKKQGSYEQGRTVPECVSTPRRLRSQERGVDSMASQMFQNNESGIGSTSQVSSSSQEEALIPINYSITVAHPTLDLCFEQLNPRESLRQASIEQFISEMSALCEKMSAVNTDYRVPMLLNDVISESEAEAVFQNFTEITFSLVRLKNALLESRIPYKRAEDRLFTESEKEYSSGYLDNPGEILEKLLTGLLNECGIYRMHYLKSRKILESIRRRLRELVQARNQTALPSLVGLPVEVSDDQPFLIHS
ncbi:hypothetical protein Ciccas_004245 [Cichlidogyrus casuarinus]|uniref:PDZ domain-containing protein n=1 Tax=Cichlidogyrus casuarinus TaxID=1844966 RepID=A0ABD2QC56_9PLAT